jgi:hypothetical protein
MCQYVILVVYKLKGIFRACRVITNKKTRQADTSAHQICVECGDLKLHHGNGMCV